MMGYTLDELVNLPDDKFDKLCEALGLDTYFTADELWKSVKNFVQNPKRLKSTYELVKNGRHPPPVFII